MTKKQRAALCVEALEKEYTEAEERIIYPTIEEIKKSSFIQAPHSSGEIFLKFDIHSLIDILLILLAIV